MSVKNCVWMIAALSLALLLGTAGCSGEPEETNQDERGVLSDPGELKADGTNSCVGRCGKKAPSGCWCDQLCARFGDCCLDKGAYCGGPVPLSCDNVTCASGFHCAMKGINGKSIPVCIKDPILTDTCQSLGGHCLPLTYPASQCATDEKADATAGLCPIIPGSTGTCCRPAPKPTVSCQSVGGHCLPLTNPPSQCAAGETIDTSASCPLMPGSTSTCCVPVAKPTCQDLGGHCLPLTYPASQCTVGEKADATAGLCPIIPGSTGTCCLPDPTVAPVVVTESDNGKMISAPVGSTVEIRLEGNPTTGYEWTLVSTDTTLPLSGSNYTQDPAPPNMVGVGGTYSFQFKVGAGAAKAQHVIQLKYARSWEPAPLLTFSVTINVP